MKMCLTIPGAAVLTISALSLLRAEVNPSAPIQFNTSPYESPRAVALGDMDKDAKLDAVIVSDLLADYACFKGLGDGTFGSKIASGDLYLSPSDLVVGDFNGDGALDIAAINSACLS